jgi:hypothetical protein
MKRMDYIKKQTSCDVVENSVIVTFCVTEMHTASPYFIVGLYFPISFKQRKKIVTLKTEMFVVFIL